MQSREVFSFYFPLSCCLALVEIYAGLNPYAHLGPLILYNRIGFDRSRGSQSPKSRTRIAPNGLRLIVRADERLTAFLELESVISASNAWRLLENCAAASPRGAA